MRYGGLIKNDIINGKKVCVSLWVAGCPLRCEGCHNPELWKYSNGMRAPSNLKDIIIRAISANGIQRNFSVLGGEPFASYNMLFVARIIEAVREAYPDITIFVWTGYTLSQLRALKSDTVTRILKNVDVLIDGPYEQDKRDITLPLRGSTNQRILYRGKDF